MSEKQSTLQLEGERATEMLHGKAVAIVWRHRPSEVVVEFTDGTRLFVDNTSGGLELSITDGKPAYTVK